MHALLIAEQNVEKLQEFFKDTRTGQFDLGPYLRHKSAWYVIRGFVPYLGAPEDFGILPAYAFESKFEYDAVKILSDWDQIVRK